MVKRRLPKKIWIPLAIVAGIATLIYGLVLYDNYTRPSRLISIVQDVAVNKDLFTRSRLIDIHEEIIWENINGDGTLEGTFQLSKEETQTLLSSNSPLKCPPETNCFVRYHTVDVPGGVLYSLDIDEVKNQAHWTISWY